MRLTFADLVAPYRPRDFLRTVWSKRPQHLPGSPGRFAALLTWSDLNGILRHHHLAPPRLRLARGGSILPADAFVDDVVMPSGEEIPRVRPVRLESELRKGGALVLDAIDELHEPIVELAAMLEHALDEHVQVNAYAGAPSSRGFAPHWDAHDVLILQVAGSKRWTVYGVARRSPIREDVVPNTERPRRVTWRGILRDGDVLYLPRGWWHVAESRGEPSLHLTCGIANRTGLDLLHWMWRRLCEQEGVRADIPRFGPRADRTRFVQRLRRHLRTELAGDVVARYLRDRAIHAEPRPRFGLPWSMGASALPPGDAGSLRLTVPRAVKLTRGARGAIELAANGRRWRVPRSVSPQLHRLATGQPVPVKDLLALAPRGAGRSATRRLLEQMVRAGLAAVIAD